MYLLPVLGGRNVFESSFAVSDLAAASRASVTVILCGEKAEATSWGSFMSLASFRRMYKYRRSAKRRTRMAIVVLIRNVVEKLVSSSACRDDWQLCFRTI